MKSTASGQEVVFYATIGAWIKERRKSAKLSREKFGARLGVHRNIVMRWEHGYQISAWMYARVCREFGKQLIPVSAEIHSEVLQRVA